MMLPSLATTDDLEVRLGATIDDLSQAEWMLAYASTLVRQWCGQDWVDGDGALTGVPDAVRLTVVEIVDRASRNPSGVTAETDVAGPMQLTRSYGAEAASRCFLSAQDKTMLAAYRLGGGVWIERVTRGDVETPAVIDPLRGLR